MRPIARISSVTLSLPAVIFSGSGSVWKKKRPGVRGAVSRMSRLSTAPWSS